MPQDGSNNYQYPPGTPGIPDTTIESEAYNTFLDDLVINDLNIPRPVHRGGTGASTADAALANLKAEKAEQVVTAYLSHLWMPGSFRSAIGATDAPVAGHAFAGICYINEPLVSPPTNANVTVEARDMTDGKLYVRQKTAGVWAAWLEQAGGTSDLDAAYVNTAGDTMTGSLILPGDPVIALHAAPKQYVDARVLDQAAYSGMQINGSMEVSQEKGTAVTTTNNTYVVDGWMIFKGGAMGIGFQQGVTGSGLPGFNSWIAMAVTTASPALGAGDIVCLFQPIEGYRVARLAWGTAQARPITIGFWTAHNRTGTYSVVVRNVTPIRCYATTYTQVLGGVWEYHTITIPGDTTGTWNASIGAGIRIFFTQACGATLTAPTANVWSSGDYYAAPGQVNDVAATSDNFLLTGVTVLPGSQAPTAAQSPLIMRPYDQELLTCQRYYFKSSSSQTPFQGNSGNTTVAVGSANFPVYMRTAPTVTIINGIAYIWNINTNTTGAAVAAGGISSNFFNSITKADSFPNAGYIYGVIYSADARL